MAAKKKTSPPPAPAARQPQGAAPSRSGAPHVLAYCAILIVAAALRFSMLPSMPPGLCFDESINGVNLMEAIQTGSWKIFYPDNNGREGLFINLQGLFVMLQMAFATSSGPFQLQPWMLRFPSAVFGLLTVAGLYPLVLRLTASRLAAAAAALFLATSFWHVNFSRIGFRAISAPCFLVWSLYFLISGFRYWAGAGCAGGLVRLAAAGVVYGAGFHSYIAYRITPIIVLAVLAWLWLEAPRAFPTRERLLGIALFALCAMLAAAPLAVYFLRNPGAFSGRSAQVSLLAAKDPVKQFVENALKTAGMFNFAGDAFWRHNYAGKPQLYFPVGVLFLAGIALTLRRAVRQRLWRQAAPGLIALLWLGAGAVPVLASNENVPHALRGLLMVPACCLLAALAAGPLFTWLEGRYSRFAATACSALFAVFLAWNCADTYFNDYAKRPELEQAFEIEWVELGREISQASSIPRKYIVVPGGKLDERGTPSFVYPMALLAGAYNPQARAERNIHFVVTREEAERVSTEPGALVFLVQTR